MVAVRRRGVDVRRRARACRATRYRRLAVCRVSGRSGSLSRNSGPALFRRRGAAGSNGRRGTINAFAIYSLRRRSCCGPGSRVGSKHSRRRPRRRSPSRGTGLAAYLWYLSSTAWSVFGPQAAAPPLHDDFPGDDIPGDSDDSRRPAARPIISLRPAIRACSPFAHDISRGAVAVSGLCSPLLAAVKPLNMRQCS